MSPRRKNKPAIPGDCCKCGLCCLPCYPEDESYVEVDEKDRSRLRPYERSHLEDCHSYWRIRTWPDREYGRRCYFLRGELAGKKCECSLYDRRPELCRDFKRGGMECLEVLVHYQAEFGEIQA